MGFNGCLILILALNDLWNKIYFSFDVGDTYLFTYMLLDFSWSL